MPALLHGQGRGRHQQVHHPVAQRGSGHGHHKHGLARDLGQRAARGGAFGRRLMRRKFDEAQGREGHQRHANQGQVGADEAGACQVHRQVGQVGPDEGADDAASQHQRQGLFLVRGGHQFGPGEAVQRRVGLVEACQRGGCQQQTETLRLHGPGTGGGRERGHAQPELERALASPLHLQPRHQRRAQRPADDVAGDRQRGHPSHRREREAHQPIDRDEGHGVGQEHALAEGQQQQVSVHEPSSHRLPTRSRPEGGGQTPARCRQRPTTRRSCPGS